jgi:hypothetical protein
MGFWTWRRFSWALVCLTLLGSIVVHAQEEAPVPWLMQPLEPPSLLELSEPRMELDYTRRQRPGWVYVRFRTQVHNSQKHPIKQSLLFVCSDADATVRFSGKPLVQERLVMPLPSTVPGKRESYVTGRVSVVRLILLEGERGELVFEGHQKLEFLAENRHRVSLILPLSRAWKAVDDSQIAVRLAPELRILSSGWTKENQLYVRPRGKYGALPVELEVGATVESDSGLGAWWAVPALRHSCLWGLAAVLLGLLPGVVRRGFWWFAPPLAALLHWAAIQADPVCAQWTYFRGSRLLQAALQGYQWYVVPTLALAGALVAFWLSREHAAPKEDR